MKRRDLIKSLCILGVSGIIPGAFLSLFHHKKEFHFIGFGGAGSNFVEFANAKGVNSRFTCFSSPMRTNIASNINFILYKRPFDTLEQSQHYHSFRKAIIPTFELPTQLIQLLNSHEIPVLCCGIGGQTGTSLLKASIQYLKSIDKPFIVAASTPLVFEFAFFKKEVNRLIYENKDSKHFHIIKKNEMMDEFGGHTFGDFFRMVDEQLLEKINNSIAQI
jgi:cell division GTPase FtsZ